MYFSSIHAAKQQVNYCIFQEFEVQSVSGLANDSTSEECVKGFRIAGENMEIQFEVAKSEDKLIPAISFISTIHFPFGIFTVLVISDLVTVMESTITFQSA